MGYENLLYEVAEGVATITVNRPKVLNALNRATITELEASFTAARNVTGSWLGAAKGPKTFVGGATDQRLEAESNGLGVRFRARC